MSGGAALGGDIVTGGETLEDVDLGGTELKPRVAVG